MQNLTNVIFVKEYRYSTEEKIKNILFLLPARFAQNVDIVLCDEKL